MNTKTMEGLIGAGANIDLVNTPMRVYKEARRKGDLGTMERAMGYAGEFAVKADEYRAQADEGTQEEARENREKMEREREEAIRKRREERERLEEEIAAHRGEREKSEEEPAVRREGRTESTEDIRDTDAALRSSVDAADVSGNPIDNIIDTVEISKTGRTLSENRTILPENTGYSGAAKPTAQNLS